jgi:hypothetical protein
MAEKFNMAEILQKKFPDFLAAEKHSLENSKWRNNLL